MENTIEEARREEMLRVLQAAAKSDRRDSCQNTVRNYLALKPFDVGLTVLPNRPGCNHQCLAYIIEIKVYLRAIKIKT